MLTLERRMTDTTTIAASGIAMNAVSWILASINPVLSTVAAAGSIYLIYWGARKKKAEAKKLEQEIRHLEELQKRRDNGHTPTH